MFYKGKKVLVTGGTGFVGTHFVRALLDQGAIVRVPIHNRQMLVAYDTVEKVSADLNKLEDCLKVCEGADYVFHAAGAVAAAGVTVSNPMSAIADRWDIDLDAMLDRMNADLRPVQGADKKGKLPILNS